ncbi:MAG: ATP-grasp domain-containing protein [Bacteroidales bacterium]|nr:ATP-grasp domain-containing protein [Bacteroidales bacterium]
MNYICFSPNFPPNYFRFAVALKNSGVNVLAIGDAPYDHLHPDLHWAFTEYYKVDDLHRFDQLEMAMNHLIRKHGEIAGIDSHNEYWLETEARIRTKFHIEGLKNRDMAKIRKKSEMKKLFQKAGLNVAKGTIVKSVGTANKFIEKQGYPVIAKPDMGVGAADTYKIKNDKELKAFFSDKPDLDYIMEEFIHGDIYSFDGLVDKSGKIVFYTALKNQKGVMDVVHEDAHTYYYTLREIPEELIESGLKTLNAFNLKGRFFHFEYFREQKTGRWVALEVNMRPPGGFSTEMFNYSMDVDVYAAWAAMVSGRKPEMHFTRKYHVCFVSRKWKYPYRYSHEELMSMFGEHIVFYHHVEEVLSRAMGNFCYLIRSENLDRIFEIQKAIHKIN